MGRKILYDVKRWYSASIWHFGALNPPDLLLEELK